MNIFANLITVIIAIISISLTLYQINLSNKHALFDKRINNYSLFIEIFNTTNSAKNLLEYDKRDEYLRDCVMSFYLFIDSDFWCGGIEDCGYIFQKPLDNKIKSLFLSKIQKLNNKQLEASFIFSDKRISQYYEKYILFLKTAHRYSIISENVEKSYEKQLELKENITKEHMCTCCNEPEHRRKLFVKFEELMVIHNDIKNKPIKKDDFKL